MQDYIQKMTANSVTRQYMAGSTILYQGEVPRSIQILKKGIVRVFSISSQGDEQIVTYHTAGEFFPSSWMFGKATGSLFFYEAVTDCQISFAPRAEFIDSLCNDPVAARGLVDYFATSYAATLIRVNALEQPKAREKLLYTLFYLCQRYGGEQKTGTIRISLALTHQHLAGLVGLTRETTATEMNRLRKEKILNYTNQTYDINLERLLDLIGEDSLRGVSIKA